MSPQIADWCQNESKIDHHHNPVPFLTTRQLPIGWSSLTVVLPDTELYDKALLFHENASGNVTALLDTGNNWVGISSDHTSENGSSFSPI